MAVFLNSDPSILTWGVPIIAALVGAAIARLVSVFSLRWADQSVMRTNVDGHPVPVVLGWPLVAGALTGIVGVGLWSEWSSAAGRLNLGYLFQIFSDEGLEWIPHELTASVLLLVATMYRAGLWDDLQGDERPRGFAGHLGALKGGRVTGGIVKLVVGGLAGVAVAALTLQGLTPLDIFVPLALTMPLGANAMNLFDRAPGRALKVFLLIGFPLAIFGDPLWRTLAAGLIGAAIALFPLDVKARGMLGDAGVNPMGALLSLGLAVNAARVQGGLALVVAALLVLNIVSEKVSFSEVIANNRVLARLDHLGRE